MTLRKDTSQYSGTILREGPTKEGKDGVKMKKKTWEVKDNNSPEAWDKFRIQ